MELEEPGFEDAIEPDVVEFHLRLARPAPENVEPYQFAHRFTFTATTFPADAVGTQSFTFRPGVDFLWTGLGLAGNNPAGAAIDPLRDMFISFYIGLSRRALQAEPIPGPTLRGGGADAVARRAFALPLFNKPFVVRAAEPLRVDVDNRRQPAAAASVSYDVTLFGMRRFQRV